MNSLTAFKNNNINISAFVRNTNNAIQTIRTTSGDTVKTTHQNLGKQNAYGTGLSSTLSTINKLIINGGVDLYYLMLNSQGPDPLFYASNKGWVTNFRLFSIRGLSDEYSIQVFTFRRSRQIQLQGYQGGFGIYNLSINRKFAGKRSIENKLDKFKQALK